MEVVAINIAPYATTLAEWEDWLREFGATDFVYAQDSYDGLAAQSYQVRDLGTSVIVDRHGRIAYRDESTSTYEMLRDGVLQALD